MAEYSKELSRKAKQWIEQLSHSGWDAVLLEDSYREYSVTVTMTKNGTRGRTVIYYSPKKKQYRPVYQGINEDVVLNELDLLWRKQDQLLSLFSNEIVPEGFQIYVDGAFLGGKIGFGWILLKNGMVLKEESGAVSNEYSGMHQISGEISGVISALEFCRNHRIAPVTIHYDYEGLSAWANRRWKTNKALTTQYAAYFTSYPGKVSWQKVKGHSGSVWNEAVDKLAKKGAESGMFIQLGDILKL